LALGTILYMPQHGSSDVLRSQQFAEDGLIKLPRSGMGDDVLAAIVDSLDGSFPSSDDYIEDGVHYFHDRIMDAWRINEHVRALATSPDILALLEALFGRRPRPFQTLNFRHGTQQSPHADAFHFNSDPPGYLCAVWVALEDIDLDNGPVAYYPGSHRLPEVLASDLGPAKDPGRRDDHDDYHDHVSRVIEREGLKPVHGLLKRGQALVWSGNLLHGGAAILDSRRTRHSQVTHYYFGGCRYWVPKHSDEGSTQWKVPTWIA
jgi:hypothetical protein